MKLELEYAYLRSVVAGLARPKATIVPYVPTNRSVPTRTLPVKSAWQGIESILAEMIQRFDVGTHRCLEFGVEFGYSTVALSSFFDSVLGVDTFLGDKHTTNNRDVYQETAGRLSSFTNIQLIRSDYKDWIQKDESEYDLIHVDIIHSYADTFACGLWSADHSKCAIFHDTESFPAVKQAVIDVSRKTGKTFYNFTECNGLGILV